MFTWHPSKRPCVQSHSYQRACWALGCLWCQPDLEATTIPVVPVSWGVGPGACLTNMNLGSKLLVFPTSIPILNSLIRQKRYEPGSHPIILGLWGSTSWFWDLPRCRAVFLRVIDPEQKETWVTPTVRSGNHPVASWVPYYVDTCSQSAENSPNSPSKISWEENDRKI